MNKIGKKFLFISLVLASFSCDNEIDLNRPQEPVAFVYCILNPEDATHYVRIGRSFQTDRNIEFVENLGDSIYFDSVRVSLHQISNGETKETIPFFSDYTIVKDSGYFPSENHVLYASQSSLLRNMLYRLEIYLPEQGLTLSAETYTLNDIVLTREFYSPLFKFNFGLNTPEQIAWIINPNVRAYDLFLRFHYREIHIHDTTIKSINLPITTVSNQISKDGKTIVWDLAGGLFYNYILSNLEKNAEIRRIADSIDIGFHLYGPALHSFIQASENIGTQGLTMASLDFDNIENGIGVFSARQTTLITGFFLNHRSLDSLSCGQFTRDLNFADHEGAYYCIYHEAL